MELTFKVPIRNVFIMICYANNMPELVKEFRNVEQNFVDYEFLVELFIKETEKLLHRGWARDYVTRIEETSFISGRMNFNESIPSLVTQKPVVVCEKDEYSPDILFNQIIKSTHKDILKSQRIRNNLRKKSFIQWENMMEVSNILLSHRIFSSVTYTRHNVHYKRIIQLAQLIFEFHFLAHRSGDWNLYSVHINDQDLSVIFEKFLFHFYRLEQRNYRVKSDKIEWQLNGDETFLPTMQTDISLNHKQKLKKIIIDAKFYKDIFQYNHGKASFRSDNMYQMFAYLSHQSKELTDVRGVLIYPYNGQRLKKDYRWDDRISLEIMTVNLSNEWREIYNELLTVVNKERV